MFKSHVCCDFGLLAMVELWGTFGDQRNEAEMIDSNQTEFSQHAFCRCQQRGTRPEQTEFVAANYDLSRPGRPGTEIVRLSKRCLGELVSSGEVSSKEAEALARIEVAIDPVTNTVITVWKGAFRNRRSSNWRWDRRSFAECSSMDGRRCQHKPHRARGRHHDHFGEGDR